MTNSFKPRGRASLPNELLQFGRHLVYAEGTKTEPNYINSIKKEISLKYKCNQNQIELIIAGDRKSYNTKGLVNFAKKDVNKRLKNNEQINHVWIFFDKDDFPKENFVEAHNMINKMNNSKYENADGFKFNESTQISWHSCFSNESFELWYCLYFEYYISANSRNDYINFLDKKIINGGPYLKNKEDMHQLLISNGGSIESAIKFSKK